MNLRENIKNQYDEEERGWVSIANLKLCLERSPIEISSFLNLQEISTLFKTFSQDRID